MFGLPTTSAAASAMADAPPSINDRLGEGEPRHRLDEVDDRILADKGRYQRLLRFGDPVVGDCAT